MRRVFVVAMVLAIVASVSAEDKGQCPGLLVAGKTTYSKNHKPGVPPKPAAPKDKPTPDAEYLGRLTLNVAVSEKGYVCDASVIRSSASEFDEQEIARFKQKRFPPEMQKGEPVPANLIVSVDLWRESDGKIVEFPEPKLPQL